MVWLCKINVIFVNLNNSLGTQLIDCQTIREHKTRTILFKDSFYRSNTYIYTIQQRDHTLITLVSVNSFPLKQ